MCVLRCCSLLLLPVGSLSLSLNPQSRFLSSPVFNTHCFAHAQVSSFVHHSNIIYMMMFRRLQQQHTLQLHNVNTGDSCSRSGFAASADEKQIDQYIISQYERLRWTVHEQRKRDLASILNRIETKSRHMLKQQDEEIIRARSRAAQLELALLEIQTEQQQWKKLALDTDAQVIRLNNAVEQMRNKEEGDDAESCCDAGDQRACRRCGFKEACVVLLPCRHMCSCVACESELGWCPVCRCVKQGAIAIEPPCPFIS